MRYINLNETQGVLVAGRRIGAAGTLSVGQVRRVMEIVDEIGGKLDSSLNLRLVAVPSGDFTNAGPDDEMLYDDVFVGHRSVNGCANEMGPSGPYPLDGLREVVDRCAKIPDQLWLAVAELLPSELRQPFVDQKVQLWMTSTGPLCAGWFGYGIVGTEADADKAGMKFGQGTTQGFVAKDSADEEDGYEEDGYEEDLESQMPHGDGIVGDVLQVSYEGTQSMIVDLSDEAHAAREAATAKLEGQKGYFVAGQYD